MPVPILSRIFLPYRLRFFRHRRGASFTLLDVGCGNHSPGITKRWYPRCRYFGIDRERYNNDDCDFSLMEGFYQVDLSANELNEIPAASFDVIVAAHVLEHLANGPDVVAQLCRKLRPGGEIYIEFPSVRSLFLPHARNSLNFCDDPTHVRLYTVADIANILLANGVSVRRAGTRRHVPHLLLLPASLAKQVYSLMRYRMLDGPSLWDILGFAEYVYGQKRNAAADH